MRNIFDSIDRADVVDLLQTANQENKLIDVVSTALVYANEDPLSAIEALKLALYELTGK